MVYVLQLCDFGLSREVREIPQTSSSSSLVPQANKRGTPCYMAPELFDDGGVHSYASDLWALGCVLYECYAGRPPFIGEELTQLVKSILTDPTPSLPGNPSRPFTHLVNGLLIKDPKNRIQWSEICTHAFWGTDKLTSVDLPPQTALNNTIQTSEGLNLVRLSRIAKSNLQKENENENYENDVKTENRDMELDFNEYTEKDDTQQPPAFTPTVDENSSSTPDLHESEVSVAKTQRRVSPLDVLWHDSDLYAIPVIPLPSKNSVPHCLSSFDAIPSSDFVKLPKEKLDDFTNLIVTTLSGKTPIGEKQKVMRYLEMLSTDWDAAKILTNCSIMRLLVKLYKDKALFDLRVQLVSLIGLLIHYSISIEDDLSNSGILDNLKEVVEDSREEMEFRRLSMAALGELLYYISATQDHLTNPPEENKTSSGWQVPDTFISLLTSIVSTGEDNVTQLYALQTMKNMSSYGGNWSACFTTEDVINNLCDIFQDPNKEETFRLTAGSCLVQLVCFKVSIIPQVMEKLSFKEVAIGITKDNPKEQTICLNLLNVSILGTELFPDDISSHLNPLWKVKKLVPSLVSLVANGSEVVRGKSLLFIMLLCKKRRRWVSNFLLDGKLVSSVDTLVAKEEVGVYMRECLEVFLEGLVAVIPEFLESVVDHVEQLIVGTTTKSSKTYIQHLDVVLILARSRAFELKVVNSQELLQQLKRLLIILVENQFEGRDDFQFGVVSLYSAITQDASLIQKNPMSFVHDILPSVSIIYRGSQIGKVRFVCFKIWFQLVLDLLNESSSEEFRPICNEHFLPLYPQLLKDSVSLQVYAQKLHDVLWEYDVI